MQQGPELKGDLREPEEGSVYQVRIKTNGTLNMTVMHNEGILKYASSPRLQIMNFTTKKNCDF